MDINAQDVITLITAFIYFFATAFALFLPLYAIFNDQKKTMRLCIPISWAIQILFGYTFYIIGIVNLYPLIYFIVILIVNILSYFKLVKRKSGIVPKFDKKIIFYLFVISYTIQAFYYRFYDSFRHVGPGNPDAAAHLVMLKQIVSSGLIGNTFYAPGFHLLILPLAHFAENYGVSRFSGPIIGVFILLGIYLLLRDRVKLTSSLLLLVLFSFPLFGKFIIQTIGFFPTVVSFLFFPTILFSMTDQKINSRQYFIVNLILLLAIAVTVPYFFVQYLLFIVVLLLIVLVLARQRKTNIVVLKRKVILSLFLLFIGYVTAFGHVVLETQILNKGTGFPTIRTIEQTTQGLIISNNHSDTVLTNILDSYSKNTFFSNIAKNNFFRSTILPLANTGLDVIKIKNILYPNSLLYILSYLVTLFFFILIFISIRIKKHGLLVLSVAVFVYGVSTITGFFEMSDYRGRSGYYFVMLFIFLIVMVFDLLKNSDKILIFKKVTIAAIFLGSIYLSIRTPMEFPRLYYPQLFSVVREINNNHPEKTAIMGATTIFFILNSNIDNIEYDISNLNNNYPLTIVILEKKRFDQSKIYQNIVFSHYWDVAKNDPIFLKSEKDLVQQTDAIKNSDELKDYTLYWENENVEVLTKPAIKST